jgi:hypothetical protein
MRKAVIYGLGTLLLIGSAYFGTYAYVVTQALLWTQTALQRGPVVILFALAVANLLLMRRARRFALTPHELIALYAMLCAGTCAAGYGFVQILVNHMAAPFYENYATGSSRFPELLWPNLPTWVAPRDPAVLNAFFRGNASLYAPAVLRGWAVPVLAWSAFILAIFWTLLCLISLLRKPWVEEERLTFPLVLLPLELAESRPAFWNNRLLWAGFLVAGLAESLNFVSFLYPSWPTLPLKARAGANEISLLLTTPPWNAIGLFTLSFFPFAIGIAYLLALDVSFSCWFFYLLSRALLVGCAWLGLSDGGSGPTSRMPFLREQGAGAFVGVALFSLWAARRALGDAFAALGRRGADDDGVELMTPRMALIGGGVGLLSLTGFLMLLGLAPGQAALYVLVYTCFALTLARIVSEAGAGWAWAPGWSAGQLTADAFGVNSLTGKQAAALLAYTPWMSDMRDNPAPHTAEALKLAQGVVLRPRALLMPLLFASVVGVLAAFWAHLDIYYLFGAATAKVRPALQSGATGPARQAVTLMVSPTRQDLPGLSAAFTGGLVALGFSILRQRFAGWPLHPLGYALGMTGSMEYMWCPFFIAWLAKAITLRYAGIRGYRAALPFFLGLILGDYVVPTLWGVFGMLSHTQQYMVFPH